MTTITPNGIELPDPELAPPSPLLAIVVMALTTISIAAMALAPHQIGPGF